MAKSESRLKNSIRNSAFGLFAEVTTLILGFFVRSVFVKCLAEDYLGVNGIFTNILQVLSFAELGIGNAIVFCLYKPIRDKDSERIKQANENITKLGLENQIHIHSGDAVEILPTLNSKYDIVFIDAAKGKYPFFLKEALRMLNKNGIIFADNILYKGYVMSDYNKHKQRTAVRNLREYIKQVSENPNLVTEILEVGDGLAISRVK